MAVQQEPGKQERIPNGEAAAAIIAAGVGSLALGVFTVLAEAFPSFKNNIKFYDPSGPLSGKTTLAVVVWLIAWALLYLRWRKKDLEFGKVFWASIALIGLGVVGTFPKFFELFTRG
ncbi:MAG: hypothetical protein HYX90_11440 [Chloroflexi bacterium]|nr:hypothetical protein [Chloroflexota bacterium]